MVKQQEMLKKALVFQQVDKLLGKNEKVTIPMIKSNIENEFPKIPWSKGDIIDIMTEFVSEGIMGYDSKNRSYFDPQLAQKKTKASWITRKRAIELMTYSGGCFFTATFKKKDGSLRTMNCQYLAGQVPSQLGYLKVNEVKLVKSKSPNPIRSVNVQTLTELKIQGKNYRIK